MVRLQKKKKKKKKKKNIFFFFNNGNCISILSTPVFIHFFLTCIADSLYIKTVNILYIVSGIKLSF